MNNYLSIFFSFCRVGALTFGGGLAMLPIVEKEFSSSGKELLSKEDIADDYAMAQCAPGVIAVNTSILLGNRLGGTVGGIIAALGVTFPSIIVILIIASVLNNLMSLPVVAMALAGVRAGVCALVLRTVMNLATKSVVDKITLLLFFVGFFCLTYLDVSPVVPVIVGAVVGIISKKAGENR
ncbi:MAG: chromate transporter [Oscillospiraceae bacterium]